MIRVATFNLKNLFDRFNFHAALPKYAQATATYRWRLSRDFDVVPGGDDEPSLDQEGAELIQGGSPVSVEIGSFGNLVTPKNERYLEALLRRTHRLDADVLAVQEVENLTGLREFNALLDAPYRYLALFEGNDPRLIDVGLLSRLPIRRAISHRWVPDSKREGEFLFSRDFMAAEIMDSSRRRSLFTVWIGHFKSKFVDPAIKDPAEVARIQKENDDRRLRQAKAARDLIAEHHRDRDDRFVVCGDLNDDAGSAPLMPLFDDRLGLVDVLGCDPKIDYEHPNGKDPRVGSLEDLPDNDNWTHRHTIQNAPDKYARLDHLLVSSALAKKVSGAAIQRRTHWGLHKAGSDHDPIYADLALDSWDADGTSDS